ncbi:hypothetical protein NHX12_025181, partial [Muraenolepis orangiensis]
MATGEQGKKRKKRSGGGDGGEPKGRKVTLAMVKSCVRMTVDGKRRLDLSYKGLAAVPRCLVSLCDVEELDLSRNRLTKLPDFFQLFVNLRFLDLHSNYLENLPASIGQLQNLLTLNLCNNRLTSGSLPFELGHLGKLHKLNMGLNQLDSLPHFVVGLKELRHLSLFDNRLTAYPDCLRLLKRLEVNLESNPFVSKAAPEAGGGVHRAEGLHLVHEANLCGDCLDWCRTRSRKKDEKAEVKPQRRMLAGLYTPNSVAKANQENLLTLNLCNNRLTSGSLPFELGHLGKLHKLNMGLNQLDSLPHFVVGLKELRHLSLFDNRLTAYPDCLRLLKRLEVNLESNPFVSKAAPEAGGGVHRAEGLHLVHEANLCGDCLDWCRTRSRMKDEKVEVKPQRRMLAGLYTPNSVAKANQEKNLATGEQGEKRSSSGGGDGGEPKGRKVTLAMVKSCVRMTVDGKRRLDLSYQGLAAVPRCLVSLCDVEELDLSRNRLTKLPDFFHLFVNLRFLDLHSNY